MRQEPSNDLLGPRPFIQIPGPNPLLVGGAPGEWDEGLIEACDILRDFGACYLYYHASGDAKGWRIGVATAVHPLGPFRKHGDGPILDRGGPGSWDERSAACAVVMKQGADRYYMWYGGRGEAPEYRGWGIGLATASGPLGPWEKFDGNPIIANLEGFGYVGGVVRARGKYHLYSEHPISASGPDYGPMSLAVADAPEGPWTISPDNPVLEPGETGEWDDGGFSEASVVYWGGVFHMFYGGAKLYRPRLATRESIGYAYSYDGHAFRKYGANPVASLDANPNAAAFAEVHALFEPPLIYLYHTLRYRVPRVAADAEAFPAVENLGVQVLATGRPFRLDVPVLQLRSLTPGARTPLEDCPPVSTVSGRLALTAECGYGEAAKAGIVIHVRASCDGMRYDTGDLRAFRCDAEPGRTARRTFDLETSARFIKVVVENPDASAGVSDLAVTATVGA